MDAAWLPPLGAALAFPLTFLELAGWSIGVLSLCLITVMISGMAPRRLGYTNGRSELALFLGLH